MGLIQRSIAWVYRFACCVEQLGWINTIKIFLTGRILNKEIQITLPNKQAFFAHGRLDGVTSHFYNWGYFIEINDGPPIETIVDAGANIGVETGRFQVHYPNAEIVSVEAADRNFILLEKSFGKCKNIHCKHSALWPESTALKIIAPHKDMQAFKVTEQPITSNETVHSITIPQIMMDYNWDKIDILKLDIEGAELALFTRNYKEWIDKINVFIFEVPDVDSPGTTQVIFNTLKDLKFNTFHCGENLVLIKNHLPWKLKKVVGFEK